MFSVLVLCACVSGLSMSDFKESGIPPFLHGFLPVTPDGYERPTFMPRPQTTLEPVVLLPGLTGSVIEAELNRNTVPHFFCYKKAPWYDMWISPTSSAPGAIDCFFANLILEYNAETMKQNTPQGVTTRPKDFGGVDGLYCIAPGKLCNSTLEFGPIIDTLKDVGYSVGGNLRGATYDWRYGPDYWSAPGSDFDKLKALVEEMSEAYGQRVHFVSISMGGPFGALFLNHHVDQAWKDKYISSFIPLAAPWNGSPMVLHELLSGFDWVSLPWLSGTDFMNVCRTFGSLPWLTPRPRDGDAEIVRTPSKSYTAAQITQLLVDAGAKVSSELHDIALKYPNTLSAPNVTVFCHYGHNVSSEEAYVYADDGMDTDPKVVMGDGDGTVDLASLAVCEEWVNLPGTAPTTVYKHLNMGHTAVLFDNKVIEFIVDVVTGLGPK